MLPFATVRRLYERGPQCLGLSVDAEGVMLGPDCVLVQRLPGGGYRAAHPDALARLARTVFDDDAPLHRLPLVLGGIIAALDRGDLVKAQLLGLEIPIDRLDGPRLERLRGALDLLKDGFDPNQPRDERGRWAREGSASARMTPFAAARAPLLGRVAPAVVRGLAQLAARFAGPVAFLGTIFIPTNRSLISAGPVPDRPNLSFEYDEGAARLRLYRQDGDARSLVFEGRPDADGIIRDSDGRAIGRRVEGSVVIDPDTLPRSESSPSAQDNEPKLCPAPSKDRPGPKEKDIAYQAYVSKLVNPDAPLPRGLAIKLLNPVTGKDVYFDDCRRRDGTMIDAKGTGYLDMLEKDTDYPWDGVEAKMLKQARRQVEAAQGRPIEWHFAEKDVAEYVQRVFGQNDIGIAVIHTPPPW